MILLAYWLSISFFSTLCLLITVTHRKKFLTLCLHTTILLPTPFWINKHCKTPTICLLCLHLGLALCLDNYMLISVPWDRLVQKWSKVWQARLSRLKRMWFKGKLRLCSQKLGLNGLSLGPIVGLIYENNIWVSIVIYY